MPRHHYDAFRANLELDEVSAEQYITPIPARIRREHMEQTENPDLRDFNGIAFRHAGISPWDTVLDIGFGDGVDLMKLADPYGSFDHQGVLLGMEIPQPHSPALKDLEIDRHYVFRETMAGFGKTNYRILPDGYVQHKIERKPESVDIVIAANVFQHVKTKSQRRALHNVADKLKPGGRLIAITNGPNNKRRFHEGMKRTAYLLGANYSGPLSRKFYPQRALELLPQSGFSVDTTVGLVSGGDAALPHACYHDRIQITAGNLNVLVQAAYTYLPSMHRPAGQPKITKAEFTAALDEAIISRIRQEIDQTGASYDHLERWAIIAHKTQ